MAWTRIIFPDASAIDIGRMPGADKTGNAGLHDQVNDHFWKVWSNALMLSAFSAGIQLSQGGGNSSGQTLNATQTVAASTGQQMGQLGRRLPAAIFKSSRHWRSARLPVLSSSNEGHAFAALGSEDQSTDFRCGACLIARTFSGIDGSMRGRPGMFWFSARIVFSGRPAPRQGDFLRNNQGD